MAYGHRITLACKYVYLRVLFCSAEHTNEKDLSRIHV